MFGFSFLAMGEQATPLVRAFDKCNLVAVLTNKYLTKFIPFYVGMMCLTIADTSNQEFLPMLLRITPITLAAAVVMLAIFTFMVCARYKISPALLWKKLASSFLINLSSASVGAAFVTLFDELHVACGIDLFYNGIACNLGTIIFKPMYSVFLTISAVSLATYTGLKVTPMWLLLVVFLSVLLVSAIPNVQGGAASIIILMFTEIGLSDYVASAMISVNAILQFVIVPVNIFCLQCATVLMARTDDMIDVEVLKNPEIKNVHRY